MMNMKATKIIMRNNTMHQYLDTIERGAIIDLKLRLRILFYLYTMKYYVIKYILKLMMMETKIKK